MSPRAACRLRQLGVEEVYEFAGGKLAWLANGLPYEGTADLVGRHVRSVETCRSDARFSTVAEVVRSHGMVVVVADGDVVVGLVDRRIRHDADVRVDEVMRLAPTTVRPSEERATLDERMAKHDVHRVLVTDPAGRLLGVYERADG